MHFNHVCKLIFILTSFSNIWSLCNQIYLPCRKIRHDKDIIHQPTQIQRFWHD